MRWLTDDEIVSAAMARRSIFDQRTQLGRRSLGGWLLVGGKLVIAAHSSANRPITTSGRPRRTRAKEEMAVNLADSPHLLLGSRTQESTLTGRGLSRWPGSVPDHPGVVRGEKRASTRPSWPTRNFSKFQVISPGNSAPSPASRRYSGWRPGPLTSSLLPSGKLTP